mmetsp:Transcript_7027/g.26315  ORF Transcript_7027/g.26315 Transcript_7027/m.26315 type:complete len:178 (-) Transcript_7027:2021-2554(-)
MISPQDLDKFVEQNKDKLQPPVNAYPMFPIKDTGMLVMVIGGPNQRDDFHVNATPEFFYQYKGDMVLKIVNEKQQFQDIEIKEGSMFVLPGNTPHSPQRFKDTIGCVLEIKRPQNVKDELIFYCEKCGPKSEVYHDAFVCENLAEQIAVVIDKYASDEKLRTCKQCAHVNKDPRAAT